MDGERGSLVFVTQAIDPAHPALAATIPKVTALAGRFERIVVLAATAVPGVLPANCDVLTFAAPSQLLRGIRFERALVRALARRPDGVLAHMAPIFAILAAPTARLFGVPVLLWYTHWHADRALRAAERVSTTVLSVDRRSFPLDSPKVRAIGHGIDLTEFPCRRAPANEGVRMLALGRYSNAKGLDVVLRALRRAVDAGVNIAFDAYGPTLTSAEHRELDALRELVGDLRLNGKVGLHGPVDRRRVPALLAAADVLVNNMRAGAPDKVVYEAAASCVPVLASNPVFDSLLPETLRFERDEPASLAERLRAFAELDVEERTSLGRALRERVAREHSVDHWADEVVRYARRRASARS